MTMHTDERPPRTAWQTRRALYGPSGTPRPRAPAPRRQARDCERGARIAAAWLAEQQSVVARPRAALDEVTITRIVAAAVARISPAETAAALGWTLGEVLAAEARVGLRVVVTIEVRP